MLLVIIYVIQESIMNDVIKRIKSETPPRWKKIRRISNIIGGISLALLPLVGPLGLPVLVSVILTSVSGICGVITGNASLKTTDKELSEKPIINLKRKKNVRN